MKWDAGASTMEANAGRVQRPSSTARLRIEMKSRLSRAYDMTLSSLRSQEGVRGAVEIASDRKLKPTKIVLVLQKS